MTNINVAIPTQNVKTGSNGIECGIVEYESVHTTCVHGLWMLVVYADHGIYDCKIKNH